MGTSPSFNIDYFASNGEQQLILHMHHAIYDGISISQLLEEVEASYHEMSLHVVTSFHDFLRETRRHCGRDAMEFWSKELQDFTPLPFPERRRKAGSGEQVLNKQLTVTAVEVDAWCRHHSVSRLAIFQAALVKTLAASQDTEDVCIGNVVSGRTVPVDGVEKIVAPCFNTVPVRVRLHGDQTNVELAFKLHRKNVDALCYQLTPLRRIQTLSKTPSKRLFDCLIILQPPPRPLDREIWTIGDESGAMGMPLVFELIPNDGTFNLTVHYSERYISTLNAHRLSDAFSAALSSCLRYPAGSVEDFKEYDSSIISGLLVSDASEFEQANGEVTSTSVPGSHEEQAIREVFARLAGLPKEAIKPDTSMFQIGLDSLNAPQVATQLRSGGINVDVGDVLEGLTPALIALRSQDNPVAQRDDIVNLNAFDKKHRRRVLRQLRTSNDAVESVWPCTPVQSGMLSQSMQSNGDLYINHITYRVPKDLSTEDLHMAWAELTAKYQVLRMGFHKIDDTQAPFAMSIWNQRVAPVPFVERREKLSLNSAETKAKELIMRSINSQAWCVQTLKQNDEILMVLSLHHALYDAGSLRTILADLPKAVTSSDLGNADNIDSELIANANAFASSTGGSEFWSKALRNSV
jgi:aryl carrier-like protein